MKPASTSTVTESNATESNATDSNNQYPTRLIDSLVLEAIERLGLTHSAGPWFDAAEAADYLRIAVGTLRNWTSVRFVPHVKRGRVVRYHRDQLDAWLASGACRGNTT
jgi:excisionase family DNA binding protein